MAANQTHRGLTWEHMPGRCITARKMNFACFKIGQYPPPSWRIPAHLEGPALLLMIEERQAMSRSAASKGAAMKKKQKENQAHAASQAQV